MYKYIICISVCVGGEGGIMQHFTYKNLSYRFFQKVQIDFYKGENFVLCTKMKHSSM